MKNKGIVIFLIVLAVVIIAVMVGDWISKRPDKMEPNKFEFNVDAFKNVPEELILYKETKNFKVGFETPAGITISGDTLYLVGDKKLKLIDTTGKLLLEKDFENEPTTVEVKDGMMFIGFKNQIQVLNMLGELQTKWSLAGENTLITAIAAGENNVFVADAGTRRIVRYSKEGELVGEFEGKASADDLHGFIIPSPYFDMDVTEYDELWVVNPGLHTLEQYTEDGNLREHWRASGAQTENFSGCCNPAHFCLLPDGSFVTSEKGLVRVKIYKPSGEFLGVVAPPTKFDDRLEGQAPDVSVDNEGNIYALDFDRKLLRMFEKKNL
ncbi:hypothetical protein D1614_11280 [Maribellus luteus]|uniref:6-bladed beta-propeller n=1 Tax=Maribellus luteus TaxID=2305463 RepID=A0A399SZS5_9BACT|nr:hypothetical protein [Maribellus luteus]RIJ48304.1 hypothetical protein D1614_11280 [Maribellus luteus]